MTPSAIQNVHPPCRRTGACNAPSLRALRRLLALGLLGLLQACMMLPRTTQVYDPECQLVFNHMVLETVQVAAIHQCANQGCVALVVGAGIVSAASEVISGSIVIAGNVAYWFEKQSQCRKGPQ